MTHLPIYTDIFIRAASLQGALLLFRDSVRTFPAKEHHLCMCASVLRCVTPMMVGLVFTTVCVD